MIPITPNKTKEWTDPDTGNIFYFRYLVGEKQDEFLALFSDTSKAATKQMDKARRLVNAELTKGNKPSKVKLEQMIEKRAVKLAQSEVENDEIKNLHYAKSLVNIFLSGWKGKGLPTFPEVPSESFMMNDLFKLTEVINGMVNELSSMTTNEQKN